MDSDEDFCWEHFDGTLELTARLELRQCRAPPILSRCRLERLLPVSDEFEDIGSVIRGL